MQFGIIFIKLFPKRGTINGCVFLGRKESKRLSQNITVNHKEKKVIVQIQWCRYQCKKINSVYELADIHTMDFDRLVVSAAVTCNKSDVRSIVGYKMEEGRVVSLYVKSAENSYSNGVNQYNENSAWKMGFDISDDQNWMERYMALWKEIEARLDVVLESVVKNDAYINSKRITWGGSFRTNFHGADIPFSRSVRANTVLKIRNVYRRGGTHYPQIFVKECKITKDNFPSKSFFRWLQDIPFN